MYAISFEKWGKIASDWMSDAFSDKILNEKNKPPRCFSPKIDGNGAAGSRCHTSPVLGLRDGVSSFPFPLITNIHSPSCQSLVCGYPWDWFMNLLDEYNTQFVGEKWSRSCSSIKPSNLLPISNTPVLESANENCVKKYRWKAEIVLEKNYVLQSLAASISIFVVFLILTTEDIVFIASIGATAFIIFAMPESITAKPRNVIGGHITGIIVGTLSTLIPHQQILAGCRCLLDSCGGLNVYHGRYWHRTSSSGRNCPGHCDQWFLIQRYSNPGFKRSGIVIDPSLLPAQFKRSGLGIITVRPARSYQHPGLVLLVQSDSYSAEDTLACIIYYRGKSSSTTFFT